jgi:uncharacterized protein
MNQPVTPPSLLSEDEVRTPGSRGASDFSPEETWAERVFQGPQGLRVGWRLLLYLGIGGVIVYALVWFGKSFFPDPVQGPAALWQEMYGEFALLLAAVSPSFLMASIEERAVDDYGLPHRQAFGKLFWMGAGWGLVAVTALLIAMRGVHALYFGHLALHGGRILKFAAFWGVYFVLVGLFEEFLLRGYVLFTLTQGLGFWPSAALLSCAFGAIHLRNPGEGLVGVLGAALIGFFFCLTLRRTGNLWFAVGFHAAWDWGETYLYAVPNSGTREPGHLLGSSLHGPTWLSGGTVGPEGSVLCFLLLLLLWVTFARRYPEAKYKG